MTLLLGMDFTGDGKAKEPVGVGAVAAKPPKGLIVYFPLYIKL